MHFKLFEIEEPKYVHFKSIKYFAPSLFFISNDRSHNVHAMRNSISTVQKGSVKFRGMQAVALSVGTN